MHVTGNKISAQQQSYRSTPIIEWVATVSKVLKQKAGQEQYARNSLGTLNKDWLSL